MKNRACCWILAIFGGFLLLILIGGGLLVSVLIHSAKTSTVLKPGSYLVVDLTGRIDEHHVEPHFSFLSGDRSPSLSEMLRAFEHAQTDENIAGVILRPTGTSGMADLRELRESLREFKKSRKPVYAYLEIATDRDYYLASIADTIVMVPSNSGGMVMLGLGVAKTYLGKTFDKVGLKFNVLHVGEYKGTFEDLSSDHMSEPLRQSLQQLLEGLFNTYVSETAADRPAITREQLEDELFHGRHYLISGPEAQEKRFVDLVMDWQALQDHLAKDEDLERISVSKYLRSFALPHREQEIAVVFAEGGINYMNDPTDPLGREKSIEPESFNKELKKLRDDDNVKAVVLRVNSPGGSSLASELILQEVKRLQAKKPVVVSMGSVAASGGYYISCGADYIFAEPNTITGSIGVVSVIPTAEELYKKVQARVETVEKGKWSQFIRFDQDLGPEQKAVLLDLMGGIYDDFVGHVAECRSLTIAEVEAVASGRVWTGKEALERKLVDEIGGLEAAIGKAEELAKVKPEDVQLRYYPEEEDFIEFLKHHLDTAVREMRQLAILTPEERQVLRAAEYLKTFTQRREFVQTLAPIDLEF